MRRTSERLSKLVWNIVENCGVQTRRQNQKYSIKSSSVSKSESLKACRDVVYARGLKFASLFEFNSSWIYFIFHVSANVFIWFVFVCMHEVRANGCVNVYLPDVQVCVNVCVCLRILFLKKKWKECALKVHTNENANTQCFVHEIASLCHAKIVA